MRRKAEQLFLLIERTVPVLLAIGAVLSVLLLLFRASTALLIACIVAWGVALAAAVADFVFSCFFKGKTASEPEKSSDSLSQTARLSEVAHELKTPLTVIRGTAEVLLDGAVPEEEYPEYLNRILRETDSMARLVSDLLESTRKTGDVRFEPEACDLCEIVSSVADDFKQTAAETGVELEYRCTQRIPRLMLDPHRVGQLTLILLDNAVKHSPAGEKVTLFVARDHSGVIFGVQDHGSGIAPQDKPHIFERYYKAPKSRGGRTDGSGIGLCVAKQIAQMHGGTIDVKSEKGNGALFTVRFPLSKCKVK